MCGFSFEQGGEWHHLLVTKGKELLQLGNVNDFALLDDLRIKARSSLVPNPEKNNDWEV